MVTVATTNTYRKLKLTERFRGVLYGVNPFFVCNNQCKLHLDIAIAFCTYKPGFVRYNSTTTTNRSSEKLENSSISRSWELSRRL